MEDWTDRIVLALRRCKKTQLQLAKECGLSRESVNRILNGKEKASAIAKEKMLVAIEKLKSEVTT